ncbi:7568_t:CDS:2 [Cetraspora pellucida]|uniref:7568_t:CDS:1 n=1 Tax=Cetraspora pellucida TaxID=1433469 RepID=A0A9N9BE57_9GLOM|nr:7568_t:CDS:2 [Cetraspora pellucida]
MPCRIGNRNYSYQYNILKLRYYPAVNIQQTQRKFASDIYTYFKDLFEKYNFTDANLNCLELNVFNEQVKVKFTESNNELASLTHLDSYIYACNRGLISQDSYRYLAAIQSSLECEHIISARRKKINKIMQEKIPIKSFNINSISEFSFIIEENEDIYINKTQIGNGAI